MWSTMRTRPMLREAAYPLALVLCGSFVSSTTAQAAQHNGKSIRGPYHTVTALELFSYPCDDGAGVVTVGVTFDEDNTHADGYVEDAILELPLNCVYVNLRLIDAITTRHVEATAFGQDAQLMKVEERFDYEVTQPDPDTGAVYHVANVTVDITETHEWNVDAGAWEYVHFYGTATISVE